MNTIEQLRLAVGAVYDPELRRPFADLDMLREIRVEGDTAYITIALTIAGCPATVRIEDDVRKAAKTVPGIKLVAVTFEVMTKQEREELTERLRGKRAHRQMPFGPDSLTRVILVTSGKGGVGKSTITANLAVALAQQGLAIGLIDADVHGFSIPGLLGIPHGTQPTRVDELMLPPVAFDVKTLSIGMFLEDPNEAIAWRGPMLHRTVTQFLTDAYFGDIDILLIDMPPGTGDVAISIGQLLPHAEVLVVTTPQRAAAEVAIRSGKVARRIGQRVIGVVENMAAFTLPDGTSVDLFGAGGGAEVAEALSAEGSEVKLLASVPLSPALRTGGDDGVPVVAASREDPAAAAIIALAGHLAAQGRGLSGRSLPMHLG
jgi:ATP-binding protein involved in chromosome partitioning